MSNDNEEQALDDWAAALAEQQAADESAAQAAAAATSMAGPNIAAADIFQRFDTPSDRPASPTSIDMIMDIPVTLTVELGRTKIAIRSLLQLAQGSVVELDGLAGEPMDVLVNGCLIAQGEVVVVNDKFGIRLTDIITPAERIRRLHK
ncbi:flagellar motor switch protein FliN [Chitinimonas lacunae]|uniref:Flagellar motor switch protein FliN n=1 Tax=Chitinimonas lacunae TaxID=1963018 RepID=A0ABV8MVK6_9NEIS